MAIIHLSMMITVQVVMHLEISTLPATGRQMAPLFSKHTNSNMAIGLYTNVHGSRDAKTNWFSQVEYFHLRMLTHQTALVTQIALTAPRAHIIPIVLITLAVVVTSRGRGMRL